MKSNRLKKQPGSPLCQKLLAMSLLVMFSTMAIFAQVTSAFTYQGRLNDAGQPANGTYAMQFALFDAAAGGAQIGSTISNATVQVVGGIFTVNLDFGANSFNGAARFLEITVSNVTLTPRQQLTSTPYAVRSLNATTADNALQLNGVAANQYVQTNDTRLSDARTPTAGSANYIQNGTTAQASSNFNIAGNGTAGGTLSATTVNTETQFNILGLRVLSNAGFDNLFAGVNAGAVNQGSGNSFFGANAGAANTTGTGNSFFGFSAGAANTGNNNSFFGLSAGVSNTTAVANSFFGAVAGFSNTVGEQNSFFGTQAGAANQTGNENSFFGNASGVNSTGSFNAFFGASSGALTTGSFNTFIGRRAGATITTGSGNVFVGNDTGLTVTTGSSNTLIGSGANANAGVSFGAAIGSLATVTTSNTIVLGRNGGQDAVAVPGAIVAQGNLNVAGLVSLTSLGIAGSQPLCLNSIRQIAACSSSLRYKTNLAPYRHGLDFIARLQPISFTWKDGGMLDLGFGAEDVAKVDPLLAVYDKDGRVEGVKYDRISAVLVNAVKEQQTQITLLRDENQRLTQQSDAFKAQMTKQAEEFKAQLAALQSRLAQLEKPRRQ